MDVSLSSLLHSPVSLAPDVWAGHQLGWVQRRVGPEGTHDPVYLVLLWTWDGRPSNARSDFYGVSKVSVLT